MAVPAVLAHSVDPALIGLQGNAGGPAVVPAVNLTPQAIPEV